MKDSVEYADSDSETRLVLPSDFLGCDPDALKQELLSAIVRAKPVELRGTDVSRAGTASLQTLLAFLRESERRGVPVRLCAPSAALLDALRSLGMLQVPEVARALAGGTS